MSQSKHRGHFQVRQTLESMLRNLCRQSCLTQAIVNIPATCRREIVSWEDLSRSIWLCFIVFTNMTFKQHTTVWNLGLCLVKNTVTISMLLWCQRYGKRSSLSVCFSQRQLLEFWNGSNCFWPGYCYSILSILHFLLAENLFHDFNI